MSPFNGYDDFADCVAKNGDKSNPEAFCAWLEHNITGKWPAEASAYTPQQLVALETQATTALTALHFQALPTKSLYGVEIFATGTWIDSQGIKRTWTHDQLAAMVAAFGSGHVPLKVGHTSDKFNAQIALALGMPVGMLIGEAGHGQAVLGRVTKLTLKGDKLVADFEGVPEKLATLIETGNFNTVSAEIELGEKGPSLIGVALLGVEEPAVETLAGLAEAKVFGKAIGGQVVYAFSSAKGAITMPNEESQMKAFWETVKGFFAGRKQEELMQLTKESKISETKALFQGEDVLTAIAVALGLDPNTAKLGDLLMAIQTLKGGGAGDGKGGTMPPGMMAEHGKLRNDFAAMQKSVEVLTLRNQALEREGRIASYTKQAMSWLAIPGKPEELAVKLANIEEKAGKETADAIVTQYEAANKVAQAAGVTKPLGRSKTDGGSTDADAKLKEYGAAGITGPKAIAKLAKESPKLFREYQIANLEVSDNGK